jgi:hypothetical protein
MEAYRMDEETRSIFVETNPDKASFSIIIGPIDNGTCTAYAKFYGFKGRKDYLLFCINTGDSISPIAMHSLTIEGTHVIGKKNGEELEKNCFELRIPAPLGFLSNWYLWAEDNSARLCQKVTANPLQVIGIDGATLTVVRKESGGNFVDVLATGLQEGEQVCLVFRSMGEEFYYPVRAPESGKLRLPMVSSFVGLQRRILSDRTSILLVREAETLELSYDWDLSTTLVAAEKGP